MSVIGKKLSLLIFILLCSLLSIAKDNETVTDSIEKVLLKTKEKSKILFLYNQLANEYSSNSFEKSIKYGNLAYELAHKLKNKKQETDALLHLGNAFSNQNRFQEAIQYYLKAKKNAEIIGYSDGYANSLNSIGLNFYFQAKYDDAFKYYQQALIFSKKNKIIIEEGNSLFNLGQIFRKKNNNDSAGIYILKAMKVFERINEINGLAKTNNILGLIQFEKGNYINAVEFYKKALNYRQIKGDKKGCAILYNNIGNVFLKWGKYEQAIVYYKNSLNIFESIGIPEGIARCSNNMGLVYENLTKDNQLKINYEKALDYYNKALLIWKSSGNELELANTYNNLGNINAKLAEGQLSLAYGKDWEKTILSKDIYIVKEEFNKAIEFYNKSLGLREKLGNKNNEAASLANLGKVYSNFRNYKQALIYLNKALIINNELADKYEISNTLVSLGYIYYKMGNFSKALEYLNQSLGISIKNEFLEVTKGTYQIMSDIYSETGNCQKSQIFYKKYIEIQDSLLNNDNLKQIAEVQTQYETEKKEQQILLLNKDAKLKDVEIKQKNTAIIIFIVSLALVFVIIIFIVVIIILLVKQNKEKQRINNELAEKNKLITLQKNEITDSILYASRIQSAVMPEVLNLKELLPDSFIFFKPRDIVSGDFYWVSEKRGKIIVATADCTGHGVPGAFMSMLGISKLGDIIAGMDELHADKILNELRFSIIKSLHQTGRLGENKDGMDISLYIMDIPNKNIEFAGAFNPLLIVRNGELIEIKADRMPIGIHERYDTPFTSKSCNILKNDMVYTFSDGYADQFGGPESKKFMAANLKKLFIKIADEPIDKQYDLINQTITEWMKDLYQVDDMLIIGVRV